MDDVDEKLQPMREYLLDQIAKTEANMIDKMPQIRDANEAYRELLKGILALNGAGLAGATTLLTVSDFPKEVVGWVACLYLCSLLLTLIATTLEIGRPFLQLFLFSVGLDHARQTLENLVQPASMKSAFEMMEINERIERRMLIGRPWAWLVRHSGWTSTIAAGGFVVATLILIAEAWSLTS